MLQSKDDLHGAPVEASNAGGEAHELEEVDHVVGARLGLFVRDQHAQPLGERVLQVGRHLVLTSHQVFRGGVVLVVVFGRGVVGAALDHFLYVLRLHVDGHGADGGVGRRLMQRTQANGTRRGHAHVQLAQRLRILKQNIRIHYQRMFLLNKY